MSDTRKSFTFIWKIKNFSFSFNNSVFFHSPSFYVHEMFGTKWNLILFNNSNTYKNCVVCYLESKDYDSGPDHSELDYELSFITGNESVIQSQLVRKMLFKYGGTDWESALIVNREEVYLNKRKLFIPDDTLIIRCRLWKNQGSMSGSVRCSVGTQFNTKCITFVGTVKKFSSANSSFKNMVCIEAQSDGFHISSMNLCVCENGKLNIEIKPVVYNSTAMYRFEVFILDVFGNKVKSYKFCEEEVYDKELFCLPLTFSRDHLIENKKLYLRNDILTLKCEVIFSASTEPEQIDDMTYEYECQGIKLAISNATNANPFSEELHIENATTLKDGLLSLFNESILCDTKLKTTTQTFPAHAVVLSAQSPVFRSMFTTDMKEKTNRCVDIEDLDADTVHQMLIFMYSDTLDNLKYDSARNLYFAADKYNIVSLKQKCTNFLKQNLLHSNCCDVLLLADKHQDNDLKGYAQNYIAENDEAVFSSDEWKDLEKNQPQLIIETLRTVYSYMKKQKN